VTIQDQPLLPAPAKRWIGVPASALRRDPADVDVHAALWEAAAEAPGDAPVQVCVHGLGASYVNFMLLAPLLTRHGAVWAPDLVGFGLTPLGQRSASLDDNVDLLAGFLRTVSPGRPAIVVGNSMGGLLSLTLAAAHPELVEGLVLINPALPRLLRPGVLPDPVVTTTFLLYLMPFTGPRFMQYRARRMTPKDQVRMTLEVCGVNPDRLPEVYLEAGADMVARRRKMDYAHRAFVQATRSVVGRTRPGNRRV
jgi:pimeloyl-ACP methyl ester carboxylesterase